MTAAARRLAGPLRSARFWRRAGLTAVALILLALAAVGAGVMARRTWSYLEKTFLPPLSAAEVPVGKLPGPRRTFGPIAFRLGETNSQQMIGMNDAQNERWCDISGNFYSTELIRRFSYARPGPQGPVVRVRVDGQAPTLRGRLEARGLKPNFAYQIKLRGIFDHREAFEKIGFAGRWRLPGRGTNYTDEDYLLYPEQSAVEAYLLFDYFVTDAAGNAVREFALDSSLHVLWNASRQRGSTRVIDLLPVIVDARNPATYARPKSQMQVELLWAERERNRYRSTEQTTFLPRGEYVAELVLTEESFHANSNDGGFWATVFRCPVAFTVVARAENGDD